MAISLPIVSSFDKRGLDRARRALKSFSGFAADVGKIAAAAVTTVAVAGVREAAQFESSIAKIEGLVGVAGDELDFLAERARNLAPAFGASANEAADALFFITSAGLRGESAINVLEASLKGAAVGLGETKTIADLATSAVNAYGEAQLDGAQAVDVLTEAVRLGKLEPAELAGAMGQVLPLASNLQVSFAEVGGAMAGMSKTGTDASTAATQLRQILATIAKPTSQANEALEDMGLSAEGLREQIREEGLFSTLETLTEAFDGNIEATSTVFGNIRALSGVLDLMGESADENRELMNLMTDDIGVLDEAFAVTSETAEFKFNESMAQVKDTLLGIGEDLLERLLPYLDRFNDFMKDNGPEIEEAFDNIFGAVELVVEEMGEFLGELKSDPEFQAFIDTLGEEFAELWPEVKDAVFELANFARELAPLAGDTMKEAIELTSDLASIMSNVFFFTSIATDALKDFGIELDGPLVTSIERALNPIQRLKDLVNATADALDRLRRKSEAEINVRTGNISVPDHLAAPPLPSPTIRQRPNVSTSSLERTGAGAFLRRALGGPVVAERAYMIGERGPELFVPHTSGEIVPNDGFGPGGGSVINITVNAGMGTNGAEVGRMVVNSIRDYERRNGKVFVSA